MDAMTYAAAQLHAQRAEQLRRDVAVRSARERRLQEESDVAGAGLPCGRLSAATPSLGDFDLAGPAA